MEKILNYNSILPLKEMAFRRLGVALCNEPENMNFIAKYELSRDILWRWNNFPKRFRLVSQILSNLRLSQSLEKEMLPIIKAIFDEILRWKLLHQQYLNGDTCLVVLKKLVWTTAGSVHYRKTADELVRCDVLDVAKRFQLSCFYCLEDYIPVLWRELPDAVKMDFYDGDISQIKELNLQLFLPKILQKGENNLTGFTSGILFNSPLNYFERSVAIGNTALSDYCFRKLTAEQREFSLVQATKDIIRYRNGMRSYMCVVSFICRRLLSEVSCHLLSRMIAEEELEVFNELPVEILGCFVDWPYKDIFLDVVDKIWTSLPESKYGGLVRAISDIFFENPGYYFPNLIQQFFLRSPANFRKCFVDQESQRDGRFMGILISEKDTDTIRIILRSLKAANRARLAFTERVLFRIYSLTFDCPAVEVFLREATLTKQQKQRLKVTFKKYATEMGGIEWEKNGNYGSFFEFLDEGGASAKRKRSVEEQKSTGKKRFCSERKEKITH